MAQRYFEAPAIRIAKGCANLIRENVEEELRNDGWALNVRLDSDCMIKIFFMKADLMFRLQTGNRICAPYDLLKLEFHHKPERTEAAALAFPIQDAAKKIGDKISYSERTIRELKISHSVITAPLLVVTIA